MTRPPMTAGLLSRRSVLGGGIVLGTSAVVGGVLAACSTTDRSAGPTPEADPTLEPTPEPRSTGEFAAEQQILLAYFSRPGENYYYGGRRDLDVGNTAVLARMIADLIDCDVHRIEAADPYPAAYEATVDRNGAEQRADARPAMANPLASIDQYDTVLLGSPIWNVRTPMIMSTFTESHDFTGKTVLPFVTYAVSGLGRAQENYVAACPGAQVEAGLAVQGEEVRAHRGEIETWLRNAGVLTL